MGRAAGSGEDFQVGDGRQPLCGIVPDFRHAEEFLLQIFPPQLHSPGKARDLGRGFGAGPEAALLPAAGQQRLWIPDPGTDVQSADALGPADLVGGDGEEVRPQRFCGAWDLQKALDRVGVQQRLWVLHRQAPGDLSDGIDVSQLVVHQHAGHQRRVLPDGGEDLLRREGAVLSRDKIRHLVSLPLHPAAGFQHGAVLHCGGNDVAAQVAVLPAGGGDSPVVRLRAAGGEEQLLGPTAQCVRHGLPPDFHPALHLQPHGVLGAGVAELFGEHLIHGIRHRPGNGRSGGVVQINHEKRSPCSWALPNSKNYSIIETHQVII